MSAASARTYVLAVEFTIARSDRVWPVLNRHEDSLANLGARYVFVWESIVEPGHVLVVIGIHSEQPLVNLLRSKQFFEWFDAVGVSDIPAVFAGEKIELFDIGEPPEPGREVVVSAVTPVANINDFLDQVRISIGDFKKAGICKTLVYRAFDDSREVMFLQQLDNAGKALEWSRRPKIAATWLAAAGAGGYPPVFVGRFVNALRFAEPTASGQL